MFWKLGPSGFSQLEFSKLARRFIMQRPSPPLPPGVTPPPHHVHTHTPLFFPLVSVLLWSPLASSYHFGFLAFIRLGPSFSRYFPKMIKYTDDEINRYIFPSEPAVANNYLIIPLLSPPPAHLSISHFFALPPPSPNLPLLSDSNPLL